MYVLRQCQKAFESLSSEWCFFAGAAAGVLFPPAALLAGIILPLNRAFWVAAGTLAVLLLQWGNVLFSDPNQSKKLLLLKKFDCYGGVITPPYKQVVR